MGKYSQELVIKYINGEDLGDYDIEDLEDDKIFMIKVIEFTNDKNMYNLCSDRLKKDYEFVKYIVLKFNDNVDFVIEVADDYIDTAESSFELTELSIIMLEITNDKNKEKYLEYKILLDAIYSGKRSEIELSRAKEEDEEFSEQIGMGFVIIFEMYNSSSIVLDFYAKKMFEEIIEENDDVLEETLHRNFKTPEQIDLQGLNNYMIKFIETFDPMLSSYLSTHIKLLSSFSEKIRKIQSNWNRYANNDERGRYIDVMNKVHEYMEKAKNGILTETELIYYIGIQLGIDKKIAYYEGIETELYEHIIEEIDSNYFENIIRTSFEDRKNYSAIKKIIIEQLFNKGSSGMGDTTASSSGNDVEHKVVPFRYNDEKKK